MSPLWIADAARAAAIAGAAVACATLLSALVPRRAVSALMVAWVATPAIMIAYAWAALPIGALRHGGAVAALHGALVALRLAPLVLLLARLAPAPPVTSAALHCLRLGLRPRDRSAWTLAWTWLRHGGGRAWVSGAAMAFVLAFGEFEIGSRLNAGTWAVRLFDAQAGGQDLAATLLAALPGVVTQLVAIAIAWIWLTGTARAHESAPADPPGTASRGRRAAGWLVLALGSTALVALPCAAIAWDALAGLATLSRSAAIQREVGASLLFALCGAGCAWLVAGLLLERTRRWPRRARTTAFAVLSLPGLCGSLVVGLGLLAAFQLPGLRAISSLHLLAPLPSVVALALLGLPLALVLRLVVDGRTVALHLAHLGAADRERAPRARALAWRLSGQRRYWAWALVFAAGYCDLAASAILHPVDMTPVLAMLYNFMHYGQSSALSARLGAAILAPVAVAAIGWMVARLAMGIGRAGGRGDASSEATHV